MKKRIQLFFIGFIYVSSCYTYSQSDDRFKIFNDYSRYGIYYANNLYFKTQTNHLFGDYSVEEYNTHSFNLGVTKHINPDRKISFVTGLFMGQVPGRNIKYMIEAKDIEPEFYIKDNPDYEGIVTRDKLKRYIFHIPLLAQIKKQLAYNIFYNLEVGGQIAIMQSGSTSLGQRYSYQTENGFESKEVFVYYNENKIDGWLYPNLVISSGIYVAFKNFLLQTNFVYQKTLINYWEGGYIFDNLLVSERSEGRHKLSGDYIGLKLNVHLLRKK